MTCNYLINYTRDQVYVNISNVSQWKLILISVYIISHCTQTHTVNCIVNISIPATERNSSG